MKKVKVTCDECGARVRRYDDGTRDHARLVMRASGYGHTDGQFNKRWDICSSTCGLKLFQKYIDEILRGDDE